MVSRRAIYNDIAASTSVIFVLGKKITSGRAVPSGLRPSSTALLSGIFLPRTKKNLGLGAISLYIALRDPIYTLHISQYVIIKRDVYVK